MLYISSISVQISCQDLFICLDLAKGLTFEVNLFTQTNEWNWSSVYEHMYLSLMNLSIIWTETDSLFYLLASWNHLL